MSKSEHVLADGATVKIVALTIAAGILYGFGLGTIVAVAMPYLERTVAFSAVQLSGLVAAAMVGSVVMTPLAGPLVEWIGRRRAIGWSALLFALGAPVVCLSGGDYWKLFAGLLVQGLAMGVQGLAIPLYLAEMLPKDMRGKGTGLFQLCLIGGVLVSGLLGLLAAWMFGAADSEEVSLATKASAWKMLFAVEAIPAIFVFLGSFFISESPYWKKMAVNADGSESASEGMSNDSVWQRKYIVPFVLVVVLLACNQGVGVTALLGYSVKIFQQAGLKGAFANGADFIFKAMMFGATILSCMWVETKGRKAILKIGTGGSLLGLVIVGVTFFALDRGFVTVSAGTGWLAALGMTVLVASFAVGPGVCCWLVTTELLPGRIRAVGMGVALLFDYGISTGLQATFLPIAERAGFSALFAVLVCFAIAYFITVSAFMPETKGKSLEEIEEFFK